MKHIFRSPWVQYPLAVAGQILTLKVRFLLGPVAGPTPGLVLFLPSVLISAYFGGLWPGVLSTAMAAGLTDYFLLPPVHQLIVANLFNIIQWSVMIALGVFASATMHLLQRGLRRSEIAHAASLKSLETFRFCVTQSPNAMAMFDRDLKYLAVSGRWIDTCCRNEAEPIGKPLYQISPDLPDICRHHHRAALAGQNSPAWEFEWPQADGESRWIRSAVTSWTDERGEIGGIIVSADDVTEQRQVTDELCRARDSAEQNNLAKSALLAGMSHELRTPLNAVIGFSEALADGLFGPMAHPRQLEYVGDIHTAGRHLLELVDEILDTTALLGRKTALTESVLDVAEIVALSRQMVSAEAIKRRICLDQSCQDDLPRLRGDRRRLIQVLLNLLSNAVKFTEPGGRVTISAFLSPDGSFVVEVTDTGIGMTAEELTWARRPFSLHTDEFVRTSKGTGLGLYLADGLVMLHDGTLTLESVKNLGTTAAVTFPRERVVQAECYLARV